MDCLLIVDDYSTSRDALVELLSDAGYECLAAADGAEALDAVRRRRVDLVLLDITMPKLNGIQVLAGIRAQHSHLELPVIMVTAHSASQTVVDAFTGGANDYVTKPIDVSALLARVRTQLQIRNLARLKDEFLSIASHDLKNPLTAVLGVADTLADSFPVGAPMTAEGRMMMEIAARRTRQMIRIVTDFLDMQAADEGRLSLRRQPLDLRALARQALEDNRSYGQRKGIALTLSLSESLPLALGDEARITQVIDNLLGNAIKFSSPGGQVELAISESASCVALEVRDRGPGIAPTDLEKLFTKRARLQNQPTGGESSTGLGLSFCKRLIELHGGRIGARNRECGGAIFWFELPLAA